MIGKASVGVARPDGRVTCRPSPAGPSSVVNAIEEKAKLLSVYSMMATTAAGSGHPTWCMSAAELGREYFFTR